MSHQITILPSGHLCSGEEDQSILQAALDAGHALPYGCRDGVCGACKGKVIAGQIDHATTPETTLGALERDAGMALFCCAKPLSDLVIECREVPGQQDYPVKILPCRIQTLERLAPDVMVLHLRLPNDERLAFRAGQYVDILLKNGQRRAFSIANAPESEGLLQLHVRHIPGGHFTGQLFDSMKERDMLRFEGPHGSFRLHEESDRPILFVAGGTGFAPIKSLVEHALHIGVTRPMTFYWGARDRSGLYWPALPEAWAAAHPHFAYHPVLSDPAENDDWAGRRGLVHQAVLADYPDLSAYQVYVCGSPQMVEAARRDFLAQGLPETEFFSDVFVFSNAAAATQPIAPG